MKQTITSNSYYSVAVDPERNRLYVKMSGSWRNANDLNSCLKDISQSLDMLPQRYTCLADFTDLMPFAPEVGDKVQKQALRKLLGGQCCAQLMPRHFDTASSLEKSGKHLGYRLNMFNSEEIAEMFLDSAS
jgi:hypothetical protein